MSYSTLPPLDAARHYGPLFDAAEEQARTRADDVAAARKSCDAIKAIRDIDFTPAVAAQIAAVLSARVGQASWDHWPEAVSAIELLDGVVDALTHD